MQHCFHDRAKPVSGCTCMTFAIVYNFCLQFQNPVSEVHPCGSILAMSSLQTFLPLTSLLNLIFSGPTLKPALQIRFPYLELPYCTITNDLAMDFGLSATGQNTGCTQFRNRRHVASRGEGGGGRGGGGYILGLSHKRGGNF